MEEPVFVKCEPAWSADAEEPTNFENSQLVSEMIPLKQETKSELTEPGPAQENSIEPCVEIKEEIQQLRLDIAEKVAELTTGPFFSSDSSCKTFLEETHRKNHFITPSGETTSHITNCSSSSSQNMSQKLHILPNSVESQYQCHTFQTRTDLNRPHRCVICNATFAKGSNLKSHALTHTGERPHRCNACNATFTQKSNLKIHMLIHTGERSHRCKECVATFAHKSRLKTHMLTHTGERPHRCGVCNAAFTDRSSLKYHTLTHTGERPFPCKLCNATFAHRGHLFSHMLTHTGTRPFSCDACNATFTKFSNLNNHMLTHTGQRPFACSICNATFAQRCNLKRHKLTHTNSSMQ